MPADGLNLLSLSHAGVQPEIRASFITGQGEPPANASPSTDGGSTARTLPAAGDGLPAAGATTIPTGIGLRHDLHRVIGRGGFGTVYLASHRFLGREVAVKVLNLDSPRARTAFRAEAAITAHLEHPNIIPVYDAGEGYLAMKRIAGSTLERLIGRGAPLLDLVDILIQACNAVAFAHSRGIVHRDLKAENIMVGSYGEVLVLDWGLARRLVAGRLSADDREKVLAGTPACMAPEVALGSWHRVGLASDVFCLGAILYHILAGVLPFDGPGDLADCLARASANRHPPASELRPDAPPGLISLVAQAMDGEPGLRPDAVSFQSRLREWVRSARNEELARRELTEARRLVALAEACSRQEWETCLRRYIEALHAYDRCLGLLDDRTAVAQERQAAIITFRDRSLRCGATFLVRLLGHGLIPPLGPSGSGRLTPPPEAV